MDTFSIEDDDGDSLFITQSSDKSDKSDNVGILGDSSDFSSPCVSLISSGKVGDAQYSDISEDEFDIPCSQISPWKIR